MEEFQRGIQTRIKLYHLISALSFLVIVIPTTLNRQIWGEDDFTHGVQIGVFIGLQLILLLKSKKLRASIKNTQTLKHLYIEMNDERKKMIDAKSESMSFTIMAGSIAIATIVSGFYNHTIFITLIVTLCFILFLKAVLKYLYSKKY
ncbi:hypothetical protein [Rossellomorea aquimaris]|uniref:hypothetical protein n=1 Tax=Rossellomorea aquimaris TaxID=189382 RepID=UPI001CFDD6B3|nr:hypothetical protein [Rossellomorea aquimaris]